MHPLYRSGPSRRRGTITDPNPGHGPGVHSFLARSSQACQASFDHVVGQRQHGRRECNAQRLGSLQIEDQLKPCRLNDRQVLGLFAFEDASGITAGLLDRVGDACPIGGRRTELQILADRKRPTAIGLRIASSTSRLRCELKNGSVACRSLPPTRRAIMAAKARSSSSGVLASKSSIFLPSA